MARPSAQAQLKCESRLAVIPGETHLFEEPGALDQVTDLAGDWFGRHFAQVSHIAPAA
jgi:putative phosphoribosyl transferase